MTACFATRDREDLKAARIGRACLTDTGRPMLALRPTNELLIPSTAEELLADTHMPALRTFTSRK